MVSPKEETVINKEVFDNYLAANLRLLRRRMRLSQQDLAEKVGLNRGNVASYEAGTAEPKLCKLLQISKLVGVTSHDIVRLDLSQPSQLDQALKAFSEQQHSGKRCIESRLAKLDSIKSVLDSVKNIYNYKLDSLDLQHPDIKALSHYHEQLQSIAQELVKEQEDILQELKCHCK